jgi:hypothetical protein
LTQATWVPFVGDENMGDVTPENKIYNHKTERKDLNNGNKTRVNFEGAPSYLEIVKSR